MVTNAHRKLAEQRRRGAKTKDGITSISTEENIAIKLTNLRRNKKNQESKIRYTDAESLRLTNI